MATTQLTFQDYTSSYQTSQGVWRWTTRLDVSQAAPRYEVRDIVSPYGILWDSIPIPGVVITAMAAQIANLVTAFAPSILVAPTSLTFTLDEGRGFGPDQVLQITNSGVFGSLLNVALVTSAPWLVTQPTTVGGIGSGQTASVAVRATSASLLASLSPYAGTVTVQDATAVNNPVVVPVTVVVRPKAHIQVIPSSLTFTVTKPLSGSFPAIPSQTFTIQNTGPSGSVLDFLVQKLTGCSPWLASITPTSGSLAASAIQVVTVTVIPPASTLPGTYTEIIRVSGYSDNSYQDVTVTFIVT